MKKFMLQLFRTVVTLVILVMMALMIFDLRTRLNEAKNAAEIRAFLLDSLKDITI